MSDPGLTPQSVRPGIPVWITIPLYIVTSLLFTALLGVVFIALFNLFPQSESVFYTIAERLTFSLASLVGAWVCAIIFLKYLNRLPVSGLGMSIKNRWKDCIAGVVVAILLYLIGFSISWKFGALEVIAIDVDPGVLAGSFFVFFAAAAMEEVMMRGYVQGVLMNHLNKFVAMIIASLLFSAMHIFNDNINFLSLINLFLSGLLLGASYMYTRNLWFPIVLHTAWNWIQGPVLGYKVSGTNMFPTMLQLNLPEENIINGGKFGFEGSIVCTVLVSIATLLIIGWYEKKKILAEK